ncbi:VOC family protein [Propionibacteriaceae bacterium Y1685]|uniref:VOC family protein n=1 Tax=Microlunatus sp. Y1700 TaxID=3418487 RepID=UPI003B798ADE
MTAQLHALAIDAVDPNGLARFWGELLQRELITDPYGVVALAPGAAPGFGLRFPATRQPKVTANWTYFDLTSPSDQGQQEIVAKALDLGAQHIDVGQRPEEGHVVLADPEGNEFCVIEPDNKFLEGCGPVGALASDGTQAVGYFWAKVLDWPLVWDQDEETAIQSPQGGTKITWGGPPVADKVGKVRLHFDLRADGDQLDEAARLESLGARRVDIGQGEVPWIVLADPDGNEFCLWP